MDFIGNLMNLVGGLMFLCLGLWQSAIGEFDHRAGTMRFDDNPFLFTLVNGFWYTIGFLICIFSIEPTPAMGFIKSLTTYVSQQPPTQIWLITYTYALAATYALCHIFRRVRR